MISNSVGFEVKMFLFLSAVAVLFAEQLVPSTYRKCYAWIMSVTFDTQRYSSISNIQAFHILYICLFLSFSIANMEQRHHSIRTMHSENMVWFRLRQNQSNFMLIRQIIQIDSNKNISLLIIMIIVIIYSSHSTPYSATGQVFSQTLN